MYDPEEEKEKNKKLYIEKQELKQRLSELQDLQIS
jgi:hypothetical protein